LDKLEKKNRRLKEAGAMALIAAGALVFICQATSKSHLTEAG